MPINLALRNILRQKLRSGVTLMAVAFGVVGLILAGGFIQDIFIQLGEAIIHSQTGHLQVFKKDFIDKGTRSPERFMIENPAELEARIAQIQGVDAVMGAVRRAGRGLPSPGARPGAARRRRAAQGSRGYRRR